MHTPRDDKFWKLIDRDYEYVWDVHDLCEIFREVTNKLDEIEVSVDNEVHAKIEEFMRKRR